MNEPVRRDIHNYILITVFILFLFVVLGASIMTLPQDFNDQEQKKLAQRPFLASSKSWDEFAANWDSYVSDQFPGRNKVVNGLNAAELAISDEGKVLNDVYVLSDDYLFSYTYPVENWKYDSLLKVLTDRTKATKLPFVYIVVPQKNMVLEEAEVSIDAGADAENMNKLIATLDYANIPTINTVPEILSHSLQQRSKYYFKTDFHWNELGAFTASEYAAKQLAEMGYIRKDSVPTDEQFEWRNLTGRNYLGDLQRRFTEEVTVKEYLPIYEPINADELSYYLDFRGAAVPRDEVIASGLYDPILDYNKMCSYNMGYLRIENPSAPEIKSVLLLKDSYACAALDYLSQIFTEINVVDPRYSVADMDYIIKERDVDLVLFMYHESNVSEELLQYLKVK